MITFRQFLKESAVEGVTKLQHLQHLEDRALHSREGAEHALHSLHGVGSRLAGGPGPRITHKWDGSPSIVFGHHPQTGKFFVATKSAWNKTPKVNYTHADIERHHPATIHHVLKSALEHLPKVTPKHGVYQGDFMYNAESKHEGPKHYHFTPNTLMYSVKKDTPESKKVAKAKLGVAVHTQYHGPNLENLKASFNPELSKFRHHPDVHVIHPEVSIGKVSSGNEHLHALKHAEHAYLATHPKSWDVTASHRAHLQSYVHATSREGVKPTAAGFKQHLRTKFTNEAAKLKSDKGKLNKMTQLNQHEAHIDKHHEHYNSLLNLHHHLQTAKNAMLNHLNQHNQYETSHKGVVMPSGEGFVSHHNDIPSKLVNREEFTRANHEAHVKR